MVVNRLPQHFFLAKRVVLRREPEIIYAVVPADAPAGKGGRDALHDVVFGVVAYAQGVELHQLAGPVFVGVFLGAVAIIEVYQHRRVFGDHVEQVVEGSQAELAQLVDLGVGHPVAHFSGFGGEVTVPEQRQPFRRRRGRGEPVAGPVVYVVDVVVFKVVVVVLFGKIWFVEELVHRPLQPQRGQLAGVGGVAQGGRPAQEVRRLTLAEGSPVGWCPQPPTCRKQPARGEQGCSRLPPLRVRGVRF